MSRPKPSSPARASIGTAGRLRLRRAASVRHPQVALFVVAYLAYLAGRWVFASDLGTARVNAGTILELERMTGTAIERDVQRTLSPGPWLGALSDVYLAAQLVVLPLSLIALHRFSRSVYSSLRDTVIATWAISIPIFAAFPVAPPRLDGIGLLDTVTANSAAGLRGSSTLFYNPFAAVPSLHVGFAFAIGIAVFTAVRHPVVRVLALLWGPLVTLAVVATGNHYVFDVAAGLVVTGVGWAVGRPLSRQLRAAAAALRDARRHPAVASARA